MLQLPNPITTSDVTLNKIQEVTIKEGQRQYLANKAHELFVLAQDLGFGEQKEISVQRGAKKGKTGKMIFQKFSREELAPKAAELLENMHVDLQLFDMNKDDFNGI